MSKPLRIAFDANPVAQERLTGVGQYEKRLIESLAQAGGQQIELVGYYYDFLGRKPAKNLPRQINISYRRIVCYPGAVVNLLRRFGAEIPIEVLIKSRCDIALFPNYLSQPSWYGAKLIPFVHDLTHMQFPQSMSPKNRADLLKLLPKTIRRSAGMVTISETSKQLIKQYYQYQRDILVTPIPYEAKPLKDTVNFKQVTAEYGIKDRYVLFVGTLEPRKNITGLVEAFCGNRELAGRYSLVLCGGMDWQFESIAATIEAARQAGHSIVTTGYVSETVKDALYRHCQVVVSAAYYEGFGMPLLEALYYKKPLAVSDIPVFHEVAGDAAFYFDLQSGASIAQAILRAAHGGTNTKLSPYSGVSWRQIGDDVLEFVRATLDGKRNSL